MIKTIIEDSLETHARIGQIKGKSGIAKIKIDTILEVYGNELPEMVVDMLRKASVNLEQASQI